MKITEKWLKNNGCIIHSAMNGPDGTRILCADIPAVTSQVIVDLVNHNNRSMRLADTHPLKLRHDIQHGKFLFNGDSICFSDGQLLDGQHRLACHAMEGKVFKGIVVLGLTDAARHTMDIGKTRKLQQFLMMGQVKNASIIASSLRLLYSASLEGKKGALSHLSSASIDELLEISAQNPNLHKRAIHIKTQLTKAARVGFPHGDILGLYHIYSELGFGERCESALDTIVNHTNPVKNGAMLAYCKVMTQNKNSIGKFNQKDRMNFLAHAWQATMLGKKLNINSLKELTHSQNATIPEWNATMMNVSEEYA